MTRLNYPFRYSLMILFFLLLISIYCITSYSYVKYETNSGHSVSIIINFILPVQKDFFDSKITVIPEIPGTPVNYKTKWLTKNIIILTLEQGGEPKGQLLEYRIDNVRTVVPFIKKNVKGKVRNQVPLQLLSPNDLSKRPSNGPVPIFFNTAVDPISLKNSVVLPMPGQISPFKFSYGGRSYTDYSRWQYIPKNPMRNNESYRIIFKSGLRSLSGSTLDEQKDLVFTTASKPKVTGTKPANGVSNAQLYPIIEFNLDQVILAANLQVADSATEVNIPGKTEIREKKVIFRPLHALLPNNSYTAVLQAESLEHESLFEYEISFTTVDMKDRFWIDVRLAETHTMTVYKGDKIIRHMLASGGLTETPTPMGQFYTQDSGHSFWSHRFGEGATYWVRLVGQVLIHSVPRDSRWKTKDEEHAKLGLPASHGCVRLDENDAKWIFENIPRGTLVIIHQ